MKEIYQLRWMIERYQTNHQDLHLVYIDLKKTYDGVHKGVLGKTWDKKGVMIVYIQDIYDMYERVSISVRIQGGETNKFPITIRLHQGFALRSYHFTLVLDVSMTRHKCTIVRSGKNLSNHRD